MSEMPERPRMTRRQLREMERAQEAARSADSDVRQAPSSAAREGGDSDLPPPPQRPIMTRRQLREAAEREAAKREAAERAAAERLAAQEAAVHREEEQRAAAQEAQAQQRELAQQRLAEEQRWAAEQREAEERREAEEQRQAEAQRKQELWAQQEAGTQRRAAQERAASQHGATQERTAVHYDATQEQTPVQQQRMSAFQRGQDAPPPALETDDTPRVAADPAAAQREVQAQRPGYFPAPQRSEVRHPTFSGQPNVQPPAGVDAIRTVEETGELSPVLRTAPEESVWPSIPGENVEESEPEPAVPFRAPAWGARISAASEQHASGRVQHEAVPQRGLEEAQSVSTESGGFSGMSATPSRWPASGGTATARNGAGFDFSNQAAQEPQDRFTEFEEDDDEEYEPMFTWLRLLVLMIIAFVLGALVWLIIDKTDATGITAALNIVTQIQSP